MPYHVADLVAEGLSKQGRGLKNARILVLGVAFKRDIDDARNSPAERVIELLLQRGARVDYHDPYVPEFRLGPDVFHRRSAVLRSVALDETILSKTDGVVVVTGHRCIDYASVTRQARLVIDCCNATATLKHTDHRIVRLGMAVEG